MSPLSFNLNRSIPTNLKLNGPAISYLTQPSTTTSSSLGIATFTGIVTATYPAGQGDIVEGSFDFHWYLNDVELFNSANINIFSTDNVSTCTFLSAERSDNGKIVHVVADYIPATNEANAYNDNLSSDKSAILVNRFIEIATQPVSTTIARGSFGTYTVDANPKDQLTYQWYVNGEAVTDGLKSSGYTFSGSKTSDLTIDVGSQVVFPSGAICISVIDECSRTPETIQNSWNTFKENHPTRSFWLLQPTGYEPDRLKIPNNYYSDPLANSPITVNRDDGVATNTSDWFELCQLNTVASGTNISISIDNSGSTTTAEVQASFDLFKTKCSDAGLIVKLVDMGSEENWVAPHDVALNENLIPAQQNVYVELSHPACYNAPLNSDTVKLNLTEPRTIVNFEGYKTNQSAFYKSIGKILNSEISTDSISITKDSFGSDYDLIQFYSPEKDIPVLVRMYGGNGGNNASNVGGKGGYSALRFIMRKNEEYTILGISNSSALYLYEKAQLIAVVGQGGQAGINGNGGNGGGTISPGNSGIHATLGDIAGGGNAAGQPGFTDLSLNGIFGSLYQESNVNTQNGDTVASGTQGGKTITCTKGSHFINQGFAPCADINSSASPSRLTHADGTLMTQGSNLIRGYKAGYNIVETEGLSPNGGIGGRGAEGGSGGTQGSGGGGGSGWFRKGTVSVSESQVGGNDGEDSKITIFSVAGNNIPFHANALVDDTFSGATGTGTRIGLTNGDAQGHSNGFRYSAIGGDYYMEVRLTTTTWNCSHGFIGPVAGAAWRDLGWTSKSGARMMYYLCNNFSYGEQSGSSIIYYSEGHQRSGAFDEGNIMGFAMNSSAGAVNVYHQGELLATISNPKAVNAGLNVAVSDWYYGQKLGCESLSQPSPYSIFYQLPSEGL